MRRSDIAIESSGNLEVSRKQDTYYLEIKEDLRKNYYFALKKNESLLLVVKKPKYEPKLRLNIYLKLNLEKKNDQKLLRVMDFSII